MKKSTKLVSAVVVLAVLGGVYVGLNTYVSKEEKALSSLQRWLQMERLSWIFQSMMRKKLDLQRLFS